MPELCLCAIFLLAQICSMNKFKIRQEVTRSAQTLIRLLRERHGEHIDICDEIVPEIYHCSCGEVDEHISQQFIDDLLDGNRDVWLLFMQKLSRLIPEDLIGRSDYEALKAMAPAGVDVSGLENVCSHMSGRMIADTMTMLPN